VIAFAQISAQEWKGSARSISELNIRDVLAAIDKDNPNLIIKFGGHAMAAGLSVHPDSFSIFQRAFLQEVSKHIDASVCQGELQSDGPLLMSELNIACAREIQDSGPWGSQFPEPLFDNYFEILDQRIVGQHQLKLTLRLEEGGDIVDAIAFNVNSSEWPNHRARRLHAAYKLDINTYRGKSTLQLLIVALDVAPIMEHVLS
jgi:single-stranded-DNA-specific exonuclease